MSSYSIEDNVHIGLWTDWSRGAILGRTLTISRTEGNLLIAFTASFVAFVATRLWRVLCLIVHRCCSSDAPKHAIHHQSQVILRNSSGPDSGLVSLVRLSWAWRRLGFRRLLHLSSLAVLAALICAAFTVAGGFSSAISSAVGDVVLIDSTNCGFVDLSKETVLFSPLQEFMSTQISNAANYAQQCYTSNSSGLLGCGRFIKPNIDKIANSNASCPFQEDLCRTSHSNILLDTGYINTNDDLGLNAPVDEQASYRYILSCAPLVTEGYKSSQNTSTGEVIQYHYGTFNRIDKVFNYSMRTDNIESQYSKRRNPDSNDGLNFRVTTSVSNTFEGQPLNNSLYLPIPALQRSDGDVTIIYLSGDGVLFAESSEDEWYRSFVPGKRHLAIITSTNITNASVPYYLPEEPSSPLGCVEQFQFCNSAQPDSSNCGPLASFLDALYGAGPFFGTSLEEMTNGDPTSLEDMTNGDPTRPYSSRAGTLLSWLANIFIANPSALGGMMHLLGAKSLASQSQLYSGVQLRVPSNQWQIDVNNWFDTMLALLQASYISAVVGPGDALVDTGFWASPKDASHQVLCNSQKMRSSTHTSFSLFGLCFTYVTGALVILISVIIEPILTFFFKRRGYQRFQELEWATNQQLQLHRLAHEPLGYGKWTRATEFVPMTDKDEYLGRLDVSTNHPVIIKPSTKVEHESSHDTETTSNDETLSTNSPARDAEENPLEEQTVLGSGGPVESQAPNDAIMSSEDSLHPNGPLRLNDTTSAWDEVLLGNSQTRDEPEEQTGNKTAAVTSVASSSPGEEAISHEDVSPLDESPRRVQWQNPKSMT